MTVHCLESVCIGLCIPSNHKIFLGLLPSGNLLDVRDVQFTYSMLSFGQYLLKLEDAVCLSVNGFFGNAFTYSWEFCQRLLLSNIHLHTDGNRQPEEIRQQQKLGQCTMPAALVTIIVIIIKWGTTAVLYIIEHFVFKQISRNF